MNKKIRMILLAVTAFFVAVCLGVWAIGSETAAPEQGSQAPAESASQEKSPTAEEGKEENGNDSDSPTGFLGLVNEWISLRENGGFVTRSFGVETVQGGKVARDPNMTFYILTIVLCGALSYFLGSLNFGVIVSKKYCHDDVRTHGSGNAGMTNMARTYGAKPAALTFLGDAGKAVIATLIALFLGGNGCGYVALVCCMIGHAYPCFFGFKGGKGVSTCAGGMLVLEPVVALILFALFLVIVISTKYVSLGSIIAGGLLPVFINSLWPVLHNGIYNFDYFLVICGSVIFACFIIFLHRSNIKRLYYGEERKAGLFSKKKK